MHQITALTMANDPRLKGLSPRARLVLWGMAHTAHDTGTQRVPAGCYFRGWEWLATGVLGYDDTGPTAERATMRAIGELRTHGLVEVAAHRHGGRGPRVYRLTLM